MVIESLIPLGTPSVLASLVVVLSSMFVWSKTRRDYSAENIPPYPMPEHFLLGHVHKITGNLYTNMMKWQSMAGDVCCLNVQGRLAVFINGYQNIKEALIDNADKMLDRPPISVNVDGLDLNAGLIRASGEKWKEQRSAIMSILRNVGVGTNDFAEKIHEEIETYMDKLASFEGEPMGKMPTLTSMSVSNVMCAIVLGHRFEYDDPDFVQLTSSMQDIFSNSNTFYLLNRFPFFKYLPWDVFCFKRHEKGTRTLNTEFALKHIEKIRKDLNENEEPENLIAGYLQKMKKMENAGQSTDLDVVNLISNIRQMFTAGNETTSNSILWAIVYLLHHPDKQEKVQREIDEVVGFGRLPCLKDKIKMNYLNAVIMETQRLASVTLIAPPRYTNDDVMVGGYRIPKNSTVLINLQSSLLDEKVWDNPTEFRPERFLTSAGSLMHPPDEFIPLSMGKRKCVGESLAKMELFLFLSAMLQRFEFQPADELPDLDGEVGMVHSVKPFQVRIVDRRR